MTIESDLTRLFNRGQIIKDEIPTVSAAECFTLSKQKLAEVTGEKFTQPEEVALLTCFKRLAVLPMVEGLAFSRIKGSGSVYYTIIGRCIFSDDEKAGQTFEEITDAIYTLGDALGEMMPGDFMSLSEKRTFTSAVRHLKGKRRASELDLLGIIHFVK